MKLIVAFSAVFFTILAVNNNVSAIKCYVCTNQMGGECEKVNDGMIFNCTFSVACLKSNLKTLSKEIVTRHCGGPRLMYNNKCSMSKVCECSTDLCNSASSVAVKFAAFVPVMLAMIMKYSWF